MGMAKAIEAQLQIETRRSVRVFREQCFHNEVANCAVVDVRFAELEWAPCC